MLSIFDLVGLIGTAKPSLRKNAPTESRFCSGGKISWNIQTFRRSVPISHRCRAIAKCGSSHGSGSQERSQDGSRQRQERQEINVVHNHFTAGRLLADRSIDAHWRSAYSCAPRSGGSGICIQTDHRSKTGMIPTFH